ncbi:type II secretion system F family protein [Mycobacterium tuberculosis]|uniref:type II secretion system F family protein n=1 Tax=Mycobacterium tuberculosis TaxID=1773 RepID=UPI00272CAA2E|nr:type II secretion system F family protein [Mycobacterium tuberculosis]
MLERLANQYETNLDDKVDTLSTVGGRVSDSMENSRLFPPESIQMIRIGEESGRMDSMLERLANQYETNLDDKVDTLSTVDPTSSLKPPVTKPFAFGSMPLELS